MNSLRPIGLFLLFFLLLPALGSGRPSETPIEDVRRLLLRRGENILDEQKRKTLEKQADHIRYNQAGRYFNLSLQMIQAGLTLNPSALYYSSVEVLFFPLLSPPLAPLEREWLRNFREAEMRHLPINPSMEKRAGKLEKRREKEQRDLVKDRMAWHIEHRRYEAALALAERFHSWARQDRAFRQLAEKAARRESDRKQKILRNRQAAALAFAQELKPDWARCRKMLLGKEAATTPTYLLQKGPQAIRAQRRAYRKNCAAYVFWGVPNHPEKWTRTDGTRRAYQFFRSLNLFLPVQWLVRSGKLIWSAPVSDEPWRDALARQFFASPFPLKEPEQKEAWLRMWFDSCLKRGLVEQAGRILPLLSDRERPSAKKELDEKAAELALAQAQRLPSAGAKEKYLEEVAEEFPETEAGKKARKLAPKVGKSWLETGPLYLWKAHPQWLEQLGGQAEWADGNKENGELQALYFTPPQGESLLWQWEGPDGQAGQIVRLNPEQQGLGQSMAKAIRWSDGMEQYEMRYGRRFLPPLEMQGSAGSDGVDFMPRLLPYPPTPEQRKWYGSTSDYWP